MVSLQKRALTLLLLAHCILFSRFAVCSLIFNKRLEYEVPDRPITVSCHSSSVWFLVILLLPLHFYFAQRVVDFKCKTFEALWNYTTQDFDITNLWTLLPKKYKVTSQKPDRWRWITFFAMSEAILTKKNYDFNDTKRTLLRQKNMDVYWRYSVIVHFRWYLNHM